jgi:hypothetical protein
MSQRNRGLAAQIIKFLLLLVIAGGVTLLVAGPAQARGYRGGGFHWGVGVSLGYWGPWPYYGYGYWPYYYPDYYPVYVEPPVATTVQVQAPVQAPAVPAAPAYYYCDSPAGYYPYVSNCSRPWRAVPLTPPH